MLEVGSQSRRAVLERMVPRDIVELDHHASKRVLLIERKRADPRIDIVTLVRSGSVSPIRIVSRHRFFDLLHILAVAAVPRLPVDADFARLQDVVDLLHFVLVANGAEADRRDILGRDHDAHPVFQNTEDVERELLAADFFGFDASYFSDAVRGIDCLVADPEGYIHAAPPLRTHTSGDAGG